MGDYSAALTLLRSLLANDLADRDKAMLCLNIATIYDKLNQPIEPPKWYDDGIALKRRQGGDFVAESKNMKMS